MIFNPREHKCEDESLPEEQACHCRLEFRGKIENFGNFNISYITFHLIMHNIQILSIKLGYFQFEIGLGLKVCVN